MRPREIVEVLPFSQLSVEVYVTGVGQQLVELLLVRPLRPLDLAETPTAGWHRLEVNLPDLPPKTYILSATFSTPSPRQLLLFIRDLHLPGALGAVRCNTPDGEARPIGGVLAWDIEKLSGDLFRCWGSLKLTKPGAVVGLTLSRAVGEAGPYQGDGTGNIVFRDVSLSAVDKAKP